MAPTPSEEIQPVQPKQRAIPLQNYLTDGVYYDTLYTEADRPMGCSETVCKGSFINQNLVIGDTWYEKPEILRKAEKYLKMFYDDHNRSDEFPARWKFVKEEIERTETYDLTFEELEYGATLAWRNEPRCPARVQWQKLHCFDCRDVLDTGGMYKAIIKHIEYSYNDGKIQPAITVFRKREKGKHDFRYWNPLMTHFAGYCVPVTQDPDVITKDDEPKEKKIGDQANLEFTRFVQRLGWKGKYKDFEYLPMVVSTDGEPVMFDIPDGLVPTVKIIHPNLPAISGLGLEWYPLPGVSWLMTEIGGLQFPATPFTGWYSSIEILRDFLEDNRYPGVCERIADAMGLDRTNNMTLWKDRVAIELNTAVLHSYAKAGVAIVDQHSSLEQYMVHMKNEFRDRGGCPTDWIWLNPSQSGSLCPIYHQETLHYHLSPSYVRQKAMWESYRFPEDGAYKRKKIVSVFRCVQFMVRLWRQVTAARPIVQIYYGTETGTAKYYADKLVKIFSKSFNVALVGMDSYQKDVEKDPEKRKQLKFVKGQLTGMCLFVTSTFGNGEPPEQALSMSKWVDQLLNEQENEMYERLRADGVVHAENKKSGIKSKASLDLSSSDSESPTSRSTMFSRINMANQKKEKRKGIFGDLRYGVFALGNSSYPSFCGFGTWLDDALGDLDGTRLTKIAYGDELGDRDLEFRNWSQNAYKAALLESNLDVGFEAVRKTVKPEDVITKWVPVPSRLSSNKAEVICKDLSSQHNRTVVNAKIVKREWLSTKDQKNVLVRLEIPNGQGKGCRYAPGDHAVVFPVNSDSDVDFVLERMTKLPEDPNMTVQLQEYNQQEGWTLPPGNLPTTSIRNLLKHHLCLRTIASKSLLKYLSLYATKKEEADQLKRLATNANAYSLWKVDHPGAIDVFREFPSIRVDASGLMYRLKVLQPRYYSIASSMDYCNLASGGSNDVTMELLLTVVEYETEGIKGRNFKGFCSNFLADIDVPSEVNLYVKGTEFTLPDYKKAIQAGQTPLEYMKDQSALGNEPIVMIGAGSGLAPFRGFWQQMLLKSIDPVHHKEVVQKIETLDYNNEASIEQVKNLISKYFVQCVGDHCSKRYSVLFFGCRTQESNLLSKETSLFTAILKRHDAFSRAEDMPKEYNYQSMEKQSKAVYDALVKQGGYIYVCGKIAMADQVFKSFVSIVAQNLIKDKELEGNEEKMKLARQTAEDFVNSLRDNGKYDEDIFGT